MSESLQVDVYVVPPSRFVDPFEKTEKLWSPLSSTLIQGPNSAVLVDTPIDIESTTLLGDWIEKTAPGKKLTHIYVTHAHADHWFGAPVLLERFPGSQIVATKAVTEGMITGDLGPQRWPYWNSLYPNGQIVQKQILPCALPVSNELWLDGHVLRGVDVAHSDTLASSFLHVPDLKLVVGGDIVYGDCYQHLGEANTKEKRQQWIDALDAIAALEPAIVVPGHKRATQADGPYLIEATKEYIRIFEDQMSKAKNSGELEIAMKKLYPQRVNEYILSRTCAAAFPS